MRAEQTGFPSIDKPWLKYYSEEAIQEKLPECTMYDLIYQENQSNLSHTALNYFGKKISYKLFFEKVNEFAKAFQACGIKKEDVVTIMSLHTLETTYSKDTDLYKLYNTNIHEIIEQKKRVNEKC